MRLGVYGKYPKKRDFVSFGLPRAIVEPFERWMQTGLAASRHRLGGNFGPAFRSAPLWRFRTGAGVLGPSSAGVFMSSVDGIGRLFPLTMMAFGDAAIAPTNQWFETIEARLAACLGDAAPSDPARLIDGLPLPESDEQAGEDAKLSGRSLWWMRGAAADAFDHAGLPDPLFHVRMIAGTTGSNTNSRRR